MDLQNAKEIGRKARAYEHLSRLIHQVDKTGSAIMKVGSTGVHITVQRGDGVYLRLKTIFSSLTEDLNLITPRKVSATPRVAPVGAAPDEEVKREARRAYQHAYYIAHKDHIRETRKKSKEK